MDCKETIELFNSKAKIGDVVIFMAHKDAEPTLTETRSKAFDFDGEPFSTKFERDNPPSRGEKVD